MCSGLGRMPPPGVGGWQPWLWPGPWDSLRNGLFPSGMVLEAALALSELANDTFWVIVLGFGVPDAAMHSPFVLQNH